MKYIITTKDNDYLVWENGKRDITSNITEATTSTKVHMENILVKAAKVFPNRELTLEPVAKITASIPAPDNVEDDITQMISELKDFTTKVEARQEWLAQEISKLDKELVDIEHAAEFFTLNASQGYKLYKLLHDVRVKRRDYKNEAEKIRYLLGTKLTSDKIINYEKSIAGMETRQYTPRINKELFEV